MEEASSTFALELFEKVDAMPGTTLLRVVGHPRADLPVHQTAALTFQAGRRAYRLNVLPGPMRAAGLMTLAFMAPTALLDDAATFELSLGESISLPLPPPAPGRKLSGPQDTQADNTGSRLSEARNAVIGALEDALADRAALLAEQEEELKLTREELEHTREDLKQARGQLRRAERGWQQSEELNVELLQRIERIETRIDRTADERASAPKPQRTRRSRGAQPPPAIQERANQIPELGAIGGASASRTESPEFERWMETVLDELSAEEGPNKHATAIDRVLDELEALENDDGVRSDGGSPSDPEAA